MKIFCALPLGLALSAAAGCGGGAATALGSSSGGAVDDCAALPKPAVVDNDVCVTALTADSAHVYWVVDVGHDFVLRGRYTGPGAGSETLVPTSQGIDQILARGGKIYWIE